MPERSPLPEQLTPEQNRLRKLFYQSYRFSQGDAETQRVIFEWLSRNGHLDSLTIGEEPPSFILNTKPLQKHSHQSSEKITKDIKETWGTLKLAKRNKHYVNKNIIQSVYVNMLSVELDYQEGERPNRPKMANVKSDSLYDPHASLLRRYALHGESTGTDAFDQLHKDLRALMIHDFEGSTKRWRRSDRQSQLLALQEKWEQNHPEEGFFAPK